MATIVLGSQFGDEVMVLSIFNRNFGGTTVLLWQRDATTNNQAVGSWGLTAGR